MALPPRLVDRLAGVKAKLDRTEEQFEILDQEMISWRERENPWGGNYEIGNNGKRAIFVFKIHKPFPPRFGVMMGEIVHDMRSSLDHLASYLVELHGRQPTLTTAWPIERWPCSWERRVERRARPWQLWRKKRGGPLHGIPRESAAWALIQNSQPYARGNPTRHDPLWTLHQFWNADKHRILTVFLLYIRPERMLKEMSDCFDVTPIRVKALVSGERPLKHGTKLALFEFAEPLRRVKVDFKLTFDIAVSDEKGGYDPTPFKDTLKIIRGLYEEVRAMPYPQ